MGSNKASGSPQTEANDALAKAGLTIVQNYENLINNYQPALAKLVSAATNIDTILFQYGEARAQYNKAMRDILKSSNNCIGKDEGVHEILKQSEKLNKNIHKEYSDFSKVYTTDLVKPFEERIAQDTKYLDDQLKSFKTKFYDNLKCLQERHKQLEKLNKNRGKNKKDDKKRMELELEISQRTEALETYSQDKLRSSMTEQRKRFCFLTKKQAAHAAKLKLLYEQCGSHINEHYPNMAKNYGEDLPADCESEIIKLFPAKRHSVYQQKETPERIVSPTANSIYGSSPSEHSDSDIPPKPAGLLFPRVGENGNEDSDHNQSVNSSEAKVPAATKGKKIVKATHGFHGSDSTQLNIEPEDVIQLLIPQPRDGWHYGENERTGSKGWFPIKYTTKV